MGIGELLSGNHVIILGIMLVAMAIVMRRAASRARHASRQDPLRDTRAAIARVEQSLPGRIHLAEVRLHDLAREVEARFETRILVLDQMILTADREIRRLQETLERMGASTNAPAAGSAGPLRIHGEPSTTGGMGHSHGASEKRISAGVIAPTILTMASRGMSPEIIADATGQPIARVIALIESARSIDRRDVA